MRVCGKDVPWGFGAVEGFASYQGQIQPKSTRVLEEGLCGYCISCLENCCMARIPGQGTL